MAEQRKPANFFKSGLQHNVSHLKFDDYFTSSIEIPTLIIAICFPKREQVFANLTSLY